MNFNHIIRITPDEDGVHCGECGFLIYDHREEITCAAFAEDMPPYVLGDTDTVRCRPCLEAERECEVQRRIAEALDEYIARRV